MEKALDERFGFALKFIQILESKTEVLGDALMNLSQHEFPKELYWVDFRVDPSSLRILTSLHAAGGLESPVSELSEIRRAIGEVISVDPKIILELRRTGDEARHNIELSIELLQHWFADTWTNRAGNDFRLKATFGVMERIERYNLKSRLWEAA